MTIKRIGDFENIYTGNPLYLIIDKVDGHIEENNGNKYLVFDSTDENNEVLKSTENFGIELKIKLKQ